MVPYYANMNWLSTPDRDVTLSLRLLFRIQILPSINEHFSSGNWYSRDSKPVNWSLLSYKFSYSNNLEDERARNLADNW